MSQVAQGLAVWVAHRRVYRKLGIPGSRRNPAASACAHLTMTSSAFKRVSKLARLRERIHLYVQAFPNLDVYSISEAALEEVNGAYRMTSYKQDAAADQLFKLYVQVFRIEARQRKHGDPAYKLPNPWE